jgi:hypothetical protein
MAAKSRSTRRSNEERRRIRKVLKALSSTDCPDTQPGGWEFSRRVDDGEDCWCVYKHPDSPGSLLLVPCPE